MSLSHVHRLYLSIFLLSRLDYELSYVISDYLYHQSTLIVFCASYERFRLSAFGIGQFALVIGDPRWVSCASTSLVANMPIGSVTNASTCTAQKVLGQPRNNTDLCFFLGKNFETSRWLGIFPCTSHFHLRF